MTRRATSLWPQIYLWKRPLHFSVRVLSALSIPSNNGWSVPRELKPQSIKHEQLIDVLVMNSPNPSRVWNRYKDALLFLGHDEIPLEIHQAVLRKCTPPTAELRVAALRRIVARNVPKTPHIHEVRFQIVIKSIRAAGWKPALDDYNFILEQFAAVGHHAGSMQVYRELAIVGIIPRTKTFGLCLQAIAHRLSMPCKNHRRPFLIKTATTLLNELTSGMHTHEIPLTSANLDLAIRILKETSDQQSFASLLRIGYGIDLSYLDRPPLDHLSVPQTFSTAALNTTVDMLGRLGNVSKLVQAFETLTQPLPPEASQHFASSFEDDEDLDFGTSIAPPSASTYAYAHADPNTTTYIILLKHLSKAGHSTFARHYLRQALYLERLTDRQLRGEILKGTPLEQIHAPHFAINRGMVLPVFGEANRDKNVELMKRVLLYMRRSMFRKEQNVIFYSNVIARESLRKPEGIVDSSRHLGLTTPLASSSTPEIQSPESRPSTSTACSGDTRRAPLDNIPASSYIISSQPFSRSGKPERVLDLSAFDVDLDAPIPSHPPPPVKYFDIELHLSLLRRDLDEMQLFYKHASNVLARTLQRIKERLGRRIWNGKNIWLMTDPLGKRNGISRAEWIKIARFRANSSLHLRNVRVIRRDSTLRDSTPPAGPDLREPAPHLRLPPGDIAARRGLPTRAFSRKRER